MIPTVCLLCVSQSQYIHDYGPQELSSSPKGVEVDLDVIEEYLQEHSMEILPGACVHRSSEEAHHRVGGKTAVPIGLLS